MHLPISLVVAGGSPRHRWEYGTKQHKKPDAHESTNKTGAWKGRVEVCFPCLALQSRTVGCFLELAILLIPGTPNPLPLLLTFQIALQFPYRFWDSKVQGADFFGHVPPSASKRGLFAVFYDMDPQVSRW